MNIQLRMRKIIDLDAYVLPLLNNNILSVTDLIKSREPIMFTHAGEFSIPEQLTKIIKETAQISTKENGMCILKGHDITAQAQ